MINNSRRFLRFDGRLPHKVEGLIYRTRCPFKFYKNYDRNINGRLPILSIPQYMIGDTEFEDASNQWYNHLSNTQKIEEYGVIVDLSADDNCGYHTVMIY